jgi:hypothetical protein
MAEASIRELKQGIRMAMWRTNSPKALWCYCGKWVVAIRRLTAMPKLEHRTPTEASLGSTPDISSYAQFDWYEPVYFYKRQATFPTERKCIGRWLGVAENYREGAMKNQERLIATVRQYTEANGFAPDESDYLYESAIDEINVASDDWRFR